MGLDKKQKIVVIKVGGAKLRSAAELDELAGYVCLLKDKGYAVAVVHGGGPEINELHHQLNIPFEKIDGLRVTTKESMKLVAMVLCGAVNKRIAAHLNCHGVKSIGIAGTDSEMLQSNLVDEAVYGRVGRNPEVNAAPLLELFSLGYVPIIAPVALGRDRQFVNVNADDAAFAIALELNASSIDFISDVPGVQDRQQRVIRKLESKDVDSLIENRVVQGGMIPKLQAAISAINGGVLSVRIGDFNGIIAKTATEIIAAP